MNKISHHQVIFIGATFILSSTIITVPSQAAAYAKQHTFIALIVASLFILPSVLLLSRIAARFPGKNLFDVLTERMAVIGKIIIGIYVIFFFFVLVRDMRLAVDFVHIVLLPGTPIYITAALLIIAVWFIARGGIEPMGRFTEVYFPILGIAVLLVPLILFREFDVALLMPYMDVDLPGVLKGAWFFISYVGEVIGMFFLFSHIKFRLRYGLLSLLIGVGLLFLLVLCSQLTLGTYMMPRLFYSVYELVRQLKVTDFLDRFDLPLVGIWMPILIAKIAYSLYLVCLGIKKIIPNVSARIITTPCAVLAYVCAFLFFKDAIQLVNLNKTWPLFALIVELLIPVVLFFILKPRMNQSAKG
ncbi:GerAB/ArcD/ProY family transporter [Bacillus sp. T33-2]|uniref:GerAB/ArcD/ProY family transporter n=1 Tax=Bacillus sp. T33-2 TaxID=2054168 RepID=UPI000C76E13E|nr:endospore germination permease [Bacillus sp. T33-2]PLR98825.1 spore gernimation protein [Bacillus sp. T33-2]